MVVNYAGIGKGDGVGGVMVWETPPLEHPETA